MKTYPRTGEGPLVLVLHGPNLGALGRRAGQRLRQALRQPRG